MSDEQRSSGSTSSGKDRARDERQAKLADALRANLRRRKAAAAPGRERGGEAGAQDDGDA